jgi:hypothetical protein
VTFVVLLILAVIWTLYLASWLRNKAHERGSTTSISNFNRHLSVLERTRPVDVAPIQPIGSTLRISSATTRVDPLVRPPRVRGLLGGTPVTRADVRHRRSEILRLLAVLTVLSVVPALVVGGLAAWVAVGLASLLGTYVFLLVRAQKLAQERREKVVYLHHDVEVDEPTLQLQHFAR